jgi:hypothetical protein
LKDGKKPRFTFKEKVKILDGFHRGNVGVIYHCERRNKGKFFGPKVWVYIYSVTIDKDDDKYHVLELPEECLTEVEE